MNTGIISIPFALLAIVSTFVATAQETNLPFETLTLASQEQPSVRTWAGTVEAVNKSTVAAQTSGRVAAIHYDVDDFVAANAVVLSLTDVEQKAALEQAEAMQVAAQVRLDQAVLDLNRAKEIFEKKLIAKSGVDKAETEYQAAKAGLTQAVSAVDGARARFEYTRVRAPFSGILTQRLVDPGASINPGQPLVAGLSLEQLRVRVDVPQSEIAAVRKYGKAFIETENGLLIKAGEMTIFPYADEKTRTFRIRLDIENNPESQLYPGMLVKTRFQVGERERVLLPLGALIHRSELTAVYVIDDLGEVSLRQVRVGHSDGHSQEVLSGLVAGERVALDPVRAGIYLAELAPE